MLHGLILILKIVGILLVVILTLLLLCAGLVLFVPVRYWLNGNYDQEVNGKVRFTWLLHMFSFLIEYDKELLVRLRIFGVQIYPSKKRKRTRKAPLSTTKKSAKVSTDKPLTKIETEKATKKQNSVVEPEKKSATRDQDLADGNKQADGFVRESLNMAEKEKEKKQKFHEKIIDWFVKWYQKVRKIKLKADQCKDFFNDQKNQEVIKVILKEIKILIFHILPRRGKGRIVFGFDDPYITGQVLSVVSLCYGWIPKRFIIIPTFEEAVLEANIEVRGRIRTSIVLLWLWRMYKNKQIKEWWKLWKNRGGI